MVVRQSHDPFQCLGSKLFRNSWDEIRYNLTADHFGLRKSFWYVNWVSFVFIYRTMKFSGGMVMLSNLCLFIRVTTAKLGDNIYFTSTAKPMQYHDIKYIYARSTIECALYCTRDLYSCAGYMYDQNVLPQLQCSACYIYDVTTPLATISPSESKIINMPEIDKETGKMRIDFIIYRCCPKKWIIHYW